MALKPVLPRHFFDDMFGPTIQSPESQDAALQGSNPAPDEGENPEQPNFEPPKGFDNHGVKPGGTFNCVAKIEVEKDGSLSIVSLDGVPFKDTDGDDDQESSTDEQDTKSQPPTDFLSAMGSGNY